VSRPSGGVCPQGHASDDPDWCDVCGIAMGAPTALTPAPAIPASAPVACAACGAELDGRFCESCGHDSLAPAVPVAAPEQPAAAEQPESTPIVPSPPSRSWWAVVRVDRDWFDEVRRQNGVDAGTLEFPRYATERRFPLTGAQVAIGRRNPSRGTAPDLDLTGLDPGVSAAHAVLVARPDGGWEVVDVGSTNGTTLALADGPLPAHNPVPVSDGAVIHLGAWTTITLTTTP
jgi:FHA domain